MAAPTETQAALQNYIGSVACDSSGSIVAASSPKGGLVTYWDVATRRYLGTTTLSDGCGLAPMRHSGSFLLTSGEGWLVSTAPNGDMQGIGFPLGQSRDLGGLICRSNVLIGPVSGPILTVFLGLSCLCSTPPTPDRRRAAT